MINPFDFFKVKAGLGKLGEEHPKLFPFMQAVSAAGAKEGTIVEMKVTTPEGQVLESNLKLTANDIELFRMIREIGGAAMAKDAAAQAKDAEAQADAAAAQGDDTDAG